MPTTTTFQIALEHSGVPAFLRTEVDISMRTSRMAVTDATSADKYRTPARAARAALAAARAGFCAVEVVEVAA